MSGMDWSTYVRRVVAGDRQTEVARKTGIDQTTISRWLNPNSQVSQRISSQSVAKFARGYGRPVLEAFVVAGFLTKEEANLASAEPADLATIDDATLVAEVQRRMGIG